MRRSNPQPDPPRDALDDLAHRNARLAARVEALSRALEQAEAVTQRTAGVVHDVRNALHVVLGNAELLSGGLTEPAHRELAGAIHLAGSQAEVILRDLLTLARRRPPTPSQVNGSEVLERCRRLVEKLVQDRLECEFVADPGLWPVAIEPHHLESAVINLTLNARDAMPRGGRLRVSARNREIASPRTPELAPGEYVEFSVQDTGVGMPAHVLERATEAFFTTKQADRGTGLGLSMVDTFATRAGGALHIESEPGRGTRAEILIPRARPQGAAAASVPASEDALLGRIQGRARTEWLQDMLTVWRDARGGEELPRPGPIRAALAAYAERSLVLAVDSGSAVPALRVVRIGEALVRALERAALGEQSLRGPLLPARLEAAYRTALQSRRPSYEHAVYSFGVGPSAGFERLILPAASDGRTVSHLFGVVILDDGMDADPET